MLGTAGSGKTTLAIYRAAYLANLGTQGGGGTLLVTFNNALVTFLRFLSDPSTASLASVPVETYHKFALGYLKSRGIRGWFICGRDRRRQLISQAISDVSAARRQATLFSRPVDFFSDAGRDRTAWLSVSNCVQRC